MNRNKKIIGLVLFAVILTLLVSISSISKLSKRILNDLNESNNNHTYLTASFKYLDKDGKPIESKDKIYVFISKEENGGNRVAFELTANDGEKNVNQIYNQNGGTDNLENIDGEYFVTVAIPKPDHADTKFEESEKFESNNYDVYKSNDSYNGSYIITYSDKVNLSSDKTSKLEIKVKERDGERLTSSDFLKPLDLATGFGIFARELNLTADVESTIAVEVAEKIENNFGLSERNYSGIEAVTENGKVVINKVYTKNTTIPMPNQEIKIELTNNNGVKKTELCRTGTDGKCSVTFDDIDKGTYSISEEIDGRNVASSTTITTKDGDSIDVTFSNTTITISEYSISDKAIYNYNYVGKAKDNNSNVDLSKMHGPGTLVVNDDTLYEKYKENNEFKKEDKPIKFLKVEMESSSAIDFESEFNSLKELSKKLAKAIDSGDLKTYYMKSSDISNHDIDFDSEEKEYILVNIDCTNSTEVTVGGRNKRDGVPLYDEGKTSNENLDYSFVYDDGAKIIYNFYVAENNEIKPFSGQIKTDGQTSGVLLAPDASVEGASGNHAGTVIAKYYNHKTGEVHQKVKPKWISTSSALATITNNLTDKEEHKEQKIEIAKVDANSNPIEGAELQLLDKSGKEIEKWTSTKETHKVEHELKNGEEYTIHELTAPEGYQLARDYTFTYNGQEVQTYSMVDTQVIVNKYDETKQSLVGAQLQILDSKGTVIEEWISDGNLHVVEQKLVDGQTYYLREKQAPQGYKKAKDVKFVFNADGNNQTVNMEDQKIVLGIFVEKIDWNKKELPGAQLQILDSTGNIVESWTSDGSVYRVKSKLNIGEKYTLHEESAPEGYELSKDVEFVVKDTEDSQIITMVDNKIIIKGEPFVKIYKTDKYGSLLSGAELQLLDSNGNVIEEWISNDQAHIVDVKLQVGKKYTLHEVSAPKGYEVSDDITFTAKADEQEIKMTDERIRKVAGVVETLDNIAKYFVIFIVAITAVVLGFISIIKINKKKLSK